MSAVTDFLFDLPQPSVTVAGETRRFPVRRIFCVGRNYEAHAREMGGQPDREPPFYFTKSAHAIQDAAVAADAHQPYPPATADYHYEMELVVALGGAGFNVAPDAALDMVYGYACGLDMTRRDLQADAKAKGRPWDLGKNVEGSAVIAEIVPAAVRGHLAKGRITLKVNGTTMQDGDLADLIWPVPELIANLSTFYHLDAGDLIYTGTPAGVGPVVKGDRLEGHIDGLPGLALAID